MRDRVRFISLGFALASMFAVIGCDGGEPVRVDAVDVRIIAQDTSWRASYLVAQSPGGTTAVPADREIHVPLGAEVHLSLASRDYICTFSAPALGLHDFAAPGLPGEFRFHADRAGSFELRGDEMCGLPHTDKTRGRFLVEDPAAFRNWMHEQTKEANK